MAMFYFDVRDGDEVTTDRTGVELPDMAAARREAALLTGEMLRDRPDEFWDVRLWRMLVSDEAGLALFTIEVGGAMAPAAERELRAGRG